jgi:flagellar protein FlaG
MSSDALNTVRMQAFAPRATAATTELSAKPAPAEQPAHKAVALPITADAVKASAQQIESYLKKSGRELEFHVDEASGQMVVSVRDSATGDLIRQIPGEEVLRMARALTESAPSLVSLTV